MKVHDQEVQALQHFLVAICEKRQRCLNVSVTEWSWPWYSNENEWTAKAIRESEASDNLEKQIVDVMACGRGVCEHIPD